MKNLFKLLFFATLLFSSLVYSKSRVYVVEVSGTIDLGLSPYISRAIEDAENDLADVIIFRINTFGGRVDAATEIKDAILDSKVKTVAFIDKRAISAGSLISLSCQNIYLVPGASIGATTVVDQQGKKQAEKYQSYMRGEMRSTAERNGRRTDVAEAMVDETVVVKGLVDSTKLVTLTSDEAVKWGMADSVVSNFNELLELVAGNNPQVVYTEPNAGENIVSFLNNPIISGILIMIGTIGMFMEIKTPGWGFPGTAAVIALTLFFGAGYIVNLVSAIEIILFIIGVALLLLEVFVVPGFGAFGIVGIILTISSLFLGLLGDFKFVSWDSISVAVTQLTGALLASIVAIYFIGKFLPKSEVFNRLVLVDGISGTGGYSTAKQNFSGLIGKTGEALTVLRPAGAALIDNERIDVITNSSYIEKGARVKVVHVSGSSIMVEEIKEK